MQIVLWSIINTNVVFQSVKMLQMGLLKYLRILKTKHLPVIFPITNSRCSLIETFFVLDVSFFTDNLAQFYQFSVIFINKVLVWFVNQL